MEIFLMEVSLFFLESSESSIDSGLLGRNILKNTGGNHRQVE